MSVLFRHSPKTAKFSRFLKVAIAISYFMNEVYKEELCKRQEELEIGRIIEGVPCADRDHSQISLSTLSKCSQIN